MNQHEIRTKIIEHLATQDIKAVKQFNGYCSPHLQGIPSTSALVETDVDFGSDGASIIAIDDAKVYKCYIPYPHGHNNWHVVESKSYADPMQMTGIVKQFSERKVSKAWA